MYVRNTILFLFDLEGKGRLSEGRSGFTHPVVQIAIVRTVEKEESSH